MIACLATGNRRGISWTRLDVQQGRITYHRPDEWEKIQPGYVDKHHSDKPYFKL